MIVLFYCTPFSNIAARLRDFLESSQGKLPTPALTLVRRLLLLVLIIISAAAIVKFVLVELMVEQYSAHV